MEFTGFLPRISWDLASAACELEAKNQLVPDFLGLMI